MKGAAWPVAAGLAFLVVLMVASSTAVSAGLTPVPGPNPASPMANEAKAAASATKNAYAEILTLNYYLNFTTKYYYFFNGHGYYLYQTPNMNQSVSSPFSAAAGRALLFASTWVNVTQGGGCGSTFPCGGSYTCVGPSGGSYHAYFNPAPYSSRFSSGCLHFYVNWSQTHSGSYMIFTISRLYTFTTAQAQLWHAAGRNAILYANVTSIGNSSFQETPSSSIYAAFACGGLTAAALMWWVPYPTGQWIYSGFSFMSLDTGTVYNNTFYIILSQSFLVEWQGYPTGPVSLLNHYEFTALSATGSANANNTTGPSNVTRPTLPPTVLTEIVLYMGNVTSQSGYESASVIWQNLLGYQFNGTYLLEGSWLATATNVSLFENGVPIPSFYFQVTNTSILVFPQIFEVPYQQSIQFIAHFTPSVPFSFLETLFYLNGTPVNLTDIVVTFGVIAAVAVIYVRVRTPRRIKENTAVALEGIFLMTVFFFLVAGVV